LESKCQLYYIHSLFLLLLIIDTGCLENQFGFLDIQFTVSNAILFCLHFMSFCYLPVRCLMLVCGHAWAVIGDQWQITDPSVMLELKKLFNLKLLYETSDEVNIDDDHDYPFQQFCNDGE